MSNDASVLFPDARILVFAKAPVPGRVKTRLAETIGEEQAAQAYAHWLERGVAELCEASIAPLELWCSPDTRHPLFTSLADRYSLVLRQQPAGDLGVRMQQALTQVLSRHSAAVLIGSDCPVMQPGYIARALRALHSGIDIVLGPAEDGGYVLLGMNRVEKALFSGIPWGTPGVMRSSRERLLGARLDWAELETLWDVDTQNDYQRWLSLNESGDSYADSTRKWINRS